MNIDSVILISVLSVALFFSLLANWRNLWTINKLKQSLRLSQNDAMLFPNGRRIKLTYKIAEEKHRFYVRNLENGADKSQFEKDLQTLIFSDTASLITYTELRKYMHLNQREMYPFLERVHRAVMKEHGQTIESFFLMEQMHVMGLPMVYRLKGVEGFLSELSCPYFKEYPFILRIYREMDALRIKLLSVDDTDPITVPAIEKLVQKEELVRFALSEKE